MNNLDAMQSIMMMIVVMMMIEFNDCGDKDYLKLLL